MYNINPLPLSLSLSASHFLDRNRGSFFFFNAQFMRDLNSRPVNDYDAHRAREREKNVQT